MAINKEVYQINDIKNPDLTNELNHILQRLSDRFDKLEGLRGDSKIKDKLDVVVDDEENIVHGFNAND